MPESWTALSIDLGTSQTVAVLRRMDGSTQLLRIADALLVPSGVFADAKGGLHTGPDAKRLSLLSPDRYEPYPKQRIDESLVLLGGRDIPVHDVLATILIAVGRAAVEAVGFLPPVVLTHPATWRRSRQEVLLSAAARAGFPPVRLVSEPVAAARYFVDRLRRPVPVGRCLAVFDFGGGTLDVAVLRREAQEFTVVGLGGAPDLGGLDLDAAIVDHLGGHLGDRYPELWRAVTAPTDAAELGLRRQLWEEVRAAKEMLSRTASAQIALPGTAGLCLTRRELDQIVAPMLARAGEETQRVLERAGVDPFDLAGLFLVGGSSRLPAVARTLHARLGIAPTVLEHPELPVAEGALAVVAPPVGPQPSAQPAAATPAALPATGLVSPPPPLGPTPSVQPAAPGPAARTSSAPRRGRRRAVLAAAVVALLVASAVTVVAWRAVGRDAATTGRPAPTAFRQLQQVGLPVHAPTSFTSGKVVSAVGSTRAYFGYGVGKVFTLWGIDIRSGRRLWGPTRFTTDRDRWDGMLVAGSRLILFAVPTNNQAYTAAVVDGASGAEEWRRDFADQLDVLDDAMIQPTAQTLVVASNSERRILGLDWRTGAQRWVVPAGEWPVVLPVHATGELAAPLVLVGPYGMDDLRGRTRVYTTDDNQVSVLDASTGKAVPSTARVTTLQRTLAVGGQLFLLDQDPPSYQIRVTSVDHPQAGKVVYTAARPEVYGLAPCGHGLVCVLDSSTGVDMQVAAVDPVKGREVWRRPAPHASTLATVGDRVLAYDAFTDGPVSYLFDPAGKELLTPADQKRVAMRASATGLLEFDRTEPRTPTSPVLRGIDPATGAATVLGELTSVFTRTCDWTASVVVCAGLDTAGSVFQLWRFAAD